MKPFSRLRRLFSASVQEDGPGLVVRTPDQLQRVLTAGNTTSSGASVTHESAMRVAAVYACVRLISESVAMLPLRLHKQSSDGTLTVAKDHWLHKLVTRRPNRWQTAFDFKRMAMGHVLLTGNFYAYTARLGAEVREIVPLNPRRMVVEQDANLNLVYKYHLSNGSTRSYAAADILHLRALTMDGVAGISPIRAAAEAIGVALQAEKHGGAMFRHGVQASGILKHPENLSPEAIKRLQDSFEEKYSGAANAFRPIVLEEGLEWTKIGMTADEAQFIESRKFQRSEIAMFFGVPPHLIGDVERGTSWGSGIEVQGLGFLTHTLLPWLTNIQEVGERHFLNDKEADAYALLFDTAPLVKVDFATRQTGQATMFDRGVISANEWRKLEGLNPRTDAGGNEYRGAATAQPNTQPTNEPRRANEAQAA